MQAKQIETQVVTLVKKSKSYTKPVLYIIAGLVLLYGAIYLFTRKEQIPIELRATIDSLITENKKLTERQHQIDSTIRIYENEIQCVNTKIDGIKEKTTVIREYYHERAQAADKYNSTQVDSFFKARYGY